LRRSFFRPERRKDQELQQPPALPGFKAPSRNSLIFEQQDISNYFEGTKGISAWTEEERRKFSGNRK